MIFTLRSRATLLVSVSLKSAEDGLLVVHVISGSPAERSGLKAGDHLIGIAGKPIAGMHVDAAAQLLQGPEGSRVTLAVLRGVGPARAMTVARHVEVPSIEDVKLLDRVNGIGYLHITSFQKKTASDLDTAMRQLNASGMRSLIIDLRGNPAGSCRQPLMYRIYLLTVSRCCNSGSKF